VYSKQPNSSLAVSNALVVTRDSVLADAGVGVRDGVISEVAPDGRLRGDYEQHVDLRGAYLMPGVIDLHNDSLEVEVNPRPETNLPVEFALANLERRLLFSGVTSEFHAIAFMDNERSRRTVEGAIRKAAFLADYVQSGAQLVNNQILHRLDVWSPASLDAIFESLESVPVRYVSINDHTPGQGQYRDLEGFKQRMLAWAERRGGAHGLDTIEQRMQQRAADTDTIPAVYRRIGEEMARRPFFISSHDDDSPEKVDILHQLGATVTEFPVTVDTARRARELGMTIVVGAPNIVRGGSSSGNQSAGELFSLGLADVIVADYHAPSLLPAAFSLVDDGLTDLSGAVRALTFNAARAVGMDNLGAIEPGYVADLIAVRRGGRAFPAVERVFREGVEVLTLAPPPRQEVLA
jgi:alpha-D-ribose 1-methylphosphonate 5-triphosphate diphosphatase